MSTSNDKKYDYQSSLVKRISRTYLIAMVCTNTIVLIIFCYINLNYLYTGGLIDMANRVALQFEDTLKDPSREEAFAHSQTDHFHQQLNDLNKYSRPEEILLFVAFPNGVTSYYNTERKQVAFQKLPSDFFGVFRKAVINDSLVTEYPTPSNHFSRWIVAVPIHGTNGLSGGMVITAIYTWDVLFQLLPVFIGVAFVILLSFIFLGNAQWGFAEILESPLNNVTTVLENWPLSGFKSMAGGKRSDEIGRLIRALDELAFKLKEEQKKRDEDMERRQNFFHDISHELRTPVTTLRAQVELLRDGLATNEELPQYYNNLYQETLYIQHLVDDLLTLSRLQTPGFSIEKEPCNLVEIIKDADQGLSLMAAEQGILLSFTQTQSSNEAMVLGNYTRLRQLIMIFVENSIKYSKSGTHIQIILSDEKDGYSLVIHDEGCGIPSQDMDKVFKRQYRASNTGTAEGTGLGLQIAKEIASLLGYTLSLQSEENKGITISIYLPRLKNPQENF